VKIRVIRGCCLFRPEAAFLYNLSMSETKTVRLTETVKAAG
jgi:hypothetical protein